MFGVTHEDLWFHETTYQMREALGVANTLDRHTKALANLSIHGQRLSRQFERTLVLLQKLQKERRTEQPQQLEQPVTPLQVPQMKEESYAATAGAPHRTPWDGFVFSNDEIEPLEYQEDRAFRASETQNHYPEVA
jgi:plasmid replication initiation protein